MKLVVITGMSGAGKSVAMKALEDAGFEAIDNIPLSFLAAVAGAKDATRDLVVSADIRSRDFSREHFTAAIAPLRAAPRIVFLDCDDETLRRRFTETRRRHPLANDRPAIDGIRRERELVAPLKALADVVIDTSDMNAGELRRVMTGHFAQAGRALSLTVTSFSFRHGLPREADLVFDVRFLKNPHYVETLQPLTGRDAPVGEYIRSDEAYAPFLHNLRTLLQPLLPRYLEEGKQYLTLAVGCTGGRHRSVLVAEELAALLRAQGYAITLRHRELEK
jgi:UPF0042 nucleotide-binding protein